METQLTNCDWLSYSVLMHLTPEEQQHGAQLTAPPGYYLIEYPGTNLYKHRAILFDSNGEKLITLLWQPHSRVIDGNSLFVEIANPLLYSGAYLSIPELVQQIHHCSWQSLSRLDIATDFQPTLEQERIIDMLQHGSCYVQGKREGSQFHTWTLAEKYVRRLPKQLNWGSPQSAIKWKLYNKTLEIWPTAPDGRRWCTKPYIAKLWELNGFDTSRDTWRLEVSIMSAGQQQWCGHRLSWDTVATGEVLESLYWDLYRTRWVVRVNQGHTNKRYDKQLDFLTAPETIVNRVGKAVPANEQVRVAYAPTIRQLVRELERPEVQVNPTVGEPLLATLQQLIATTHMSGYFAAMVGTDIDSWSDEWRKKRERPGPLSTNEED